MSPRTRRLRAAGLASLTCLLLVGTTSVARADRPRIIQEDNTGFACERVVEGEPQVAVSVNYDAWTGEGSSSAEVFSPDGERDLASGFTSDVVVRDGVVAARFPLLTADGTDAGEVVLEGTYAPAAEPVTLRNRFPYSRNGQIIGTLVYTELAVTWTTLRVGGYEVSGIECFGQRSRTTNRVLQPHRLVDTFREMRLLGNCANGSLTRFEVVGSEAGVSLVLAVAGLEGFTNLALADGSDTQPVQWYAEDSGEPVEVTSVVVTLAEDGRQRSVVEATPDGLILEQIQPLSLAYALVLPGGEGTVSGTCAAESVVTRIAVEPVSEE